MPPVLPKFSVNNLFWHGNKKDVGVCSSAPIPDVRLSHCLFARISNASQPTPSDIIEFGVDINHQDTMIEPGYNTPTRTLRCITAVQRFKFARFDITDR